MSGSQPAPQSEIFPKVNPAVDGDDCDHDCESCHVKYPRGFKIDEEDKLYGFVKGWSTHVLVATGKSDWVRDVEDEKGSVMEAFGKSAAPSNGVCYTLVASWSIRLIFPNSDSEILGMKVNANYLRA